MMVRETYTADEWQFPFILYRPEEMQDDLPMILLLHGAGEAGNGGDELPVVEGNFSTLKLKEGAEYPCIFVMPQCSIETFWVAELTTLYDFIHKLIPYFKVDEKRIYLTGLSMGGYGTWYMALRYPELFAAIAPVCGGGMAWKAPVLEMPIWAFHGSVDGVVDPSESKRMIDRIKLHGNNQEEVKLTIFENVNHDSWVHAYTPELIEWLLSKSRRSPSIVFE